ncbi:MAG TPA: hypothetical protein VFE53_15540 [Mucilaginibacter sp.]|jgi:hypothetical protein|nr:hypothetical protein [Mucilaginibacter sp.]
MQPTNSPAPSADGIQPSARFSLLNIFKRDYERYDGVPPINIYLLRLLYTLMFLFLSYDSWTHIIRHTGPWDPANSAAWFMWASCAFIAVIGIRRPLKMLPIVLFEIIYKTGWLIFIALPLYQRNELTGTPAESMTNNFMLVILPIVAMPWRYFFRKYIVDKRAA